MDKRVHKQQMDVLATLYRVAYDEQDACTIKLAAEDTESKYSDKEYLGFPKIYGRNRKFAVVSNNKTRCQGVPLSEITLYLELINELYNWLDVRTLDW